MHWQSLHSSFSRCRQSVHFFPPLTHCSPSLCTTIQVHKKNMSGKSNSQLLHLGHQAVLESEARPVPGSLTQDAAFAKLRKYHQENAANLNLVDLFAKDSGRFDKYQ